jgi:tRNA modification GTPase
MGVSANARQTRPQNIKRCAWRGIDGLYFLAASDSTWAMTQPKAILLTPPAVGAIAVIALRGEGVLAVAAKLAGREISAGVRRVKFTRAGEVIDDGLAVHVSDREMEIHIHGGIAVVDAMFAALAELGVERDTQATARNLEDEIAAMLPMALTETGVRLMAAQNANWRAWIKRVANTKEIWRAASEIQWRIDRSRSLMRLIRPARVAIAGPPNAGKSTLANFLLGRKAAITSDIAGTTRDWVDGLAVLTNGAASAPVTLVDTAGIRDTGDEIERESIRRTHEQVKIADVIVAVFDAAAGAGEDALQSLPPGKILVANKMDLAKRETKGAIGISARTGEGVDQLMGEILTRLDLAAVDLAEAFIFTERQRMIVERAGMAGSVGEMKTILQTVIEG